MPTSKTLKPPVVQPGTGNNVIVNPCQRLNPMLECIRNVGKEFGDIVTDFQVGRTTGVLYLSLKYHRLHPEYIHQRIELLGHSYSLRILLIMCDVSEHQELIRELTKTCLINNITVIVAWTHDEAGLYLSTFKQFEHKPPDLIKERADKDYSSVLRTALTNISRVNKTDVETLRTSLGSFADISQATTDQLSNLPGFGQVKVKRIKEAFEKPFRNHATSSLSLTAPQAGASQPSGSERQRALDRLKTRENGKEKEQPFLAFDRLQRQTSPMWDVGLDLDDDGPAPIGPSASRHGDSTLSAFGRPIRKKRSPSPTWDIELDLNDPEEEHSDEGRDNGSDGHEQKKRKQVHGFGVTGLLAQD